ncbi:MAG: metallophosphoesterase [Bacteroidales bacterium]|nr:metallophosphoesterase [Bacteroidales bacterium]
MVKKVYILLIIACLTSCDKIDFTGVVSPGSISVDQRFEQSMAWNETRHPLVLNVPIDNYQVYVCTDLHTEQTTNNLTHFLNLERNDTTAFFSIILGDLVNVKGAMPTVHKALQFNPASQISSDTVLTIAGNHDLFNNQWEDYKTYFGTSTYYLTVKTPNTQDLFVFLDSGSGTLGRKQLEWLRNLLEDKRSQYRHCIVCSHVNMFRTNGPIVSSGNFTMEETYEICDILSENHVDFFLQGHDHHREIIDFNNVKFLVIETLQDPVEDAGYLVVQCGENMGFQFRKIINN